jgi:hypothetical protein
MKAAYFEKFGGPEVLQYGDLGDPAAAVDAEVYERLHAPMSFAVHEAGHAVVARALSLEVVRVELKFCRVGRCRDDPIARWSQAIVAVAGPAAEQRHAAYPWDVQSRLWRAYWRADRRNAEHWLGLISGVTLAQCKAMARYYVGEHWHAIVRVAEALAAEGELSGARLEALVRL